MSSDASINDDPLLGTEPPPAKPAPRQAVNFKFLCFALPIIGLWAIIFCLTMPRSSAPWPKQDPGSCVNQTIPLGNYTGKGVYATSSILHNAHININGYFTPNCSGSCVGVFHGSISSKYGKESLTGDGGRMMLLDTETCKLEFLPRLTLPGGVERFDSEWDARKTCFWWEAQTLVGAVSGQLCQAV